MNCRKARKWLPLYSGGDLPKRKSRKMEAHTRSCGSCRGELQIYKESLDAARELMQESSVLWSQAAWDRALDRAQASTSVNRVSRSLKPVWTYASMAALAVALTFLVVKPLPDLESVSQSGPSSVSSQDVISMTLVSKETGLKIQWFLNKNFNLKEDSE